MPKYVIAAGGNSNASGTWSNVSSASAGGDGVPTASDDVVLDAGSGNLTINAAMVCRSIDCNGYTGTLTRTAAITCTIGDGTAGAGNIALRLVAGMTLTNGSATTSAWAFVSTSATQQSIYCGGKTLGNVTFNASSNGSWILQDTFAANGAASTLITLSKGTLTTNNQSVSCGVFDSNNSNARSLTLGSSAITCSGSGTSWDFRTITNLTLSAGTSSITLSGSTRTFGGGGATWYNLTCAGGSTSISGANTFNDVVISGGGSHALNNSMTFANLTFTGSAEKTGNVALSGDITVSSTLTITGNSAINRLFIRSNTIGTARTLTAATVSVNAADFRDITGAGAGSWNISGASNYSGDCGGNSGITFTTPATQTATGTASFTWSTHGWTSRVPLPQDDVVVNNAFVAGRTVTMDMPRAGKSITFGCSGSPTFTPSVAWSMFGSLDLTGVGSIGGVQTATFEGRSAYSLTSAGLTWPEGIAINAVTGTYTTQDALSVTNATTHTSGTFDANDFSVTTGTFASSNSNTRTINMGNGTWTLNNTGTAWNTSTVTGLTLNPEGSTIVVANVTASAKTFAGGGRTFNNLTVSGDNVTISGANTFATLAVNTAGLTNGLRLTSAVTQTVSNITTNGSAGNLAKLVASTGGSAATIIKSGGGTITTDYMSIQDITLSTTNSPVWYAGANSTNVSGNTNITFTGPPGGAVYWVYIPRPGRIFNGSIL